MNHSKGQAVTEFIILMPVFFMLLFGIFEFTYVYRAKMTLNTATFEAARMGALNHARAQPMRSALAKGMTSLYVAGNKSVGGLIKAYGKAVLDEKAMNAAR